MARTILITGAAGFTGSHLARALLERGDRVVALGRRQGLPAFVTAGLSDPSLEFITGDVADLQQVGDIVTRYGVQDIINSAAAMGDEDSIARPRHFLRVNAEAVWGLCELARELPIRRLVCVSTRSIYGSYRPDEGPVAEDAAPRPIGFYGASKAAADVVAIQYRRHHGVDVVLPRITGLYGPEQRSNQNVLAQMVESAVAGKRFVSRFAADYPYEVTYVKDVVKGMLALLDADQLEHAVYNVGSGQMPTVGQHASVVRSVVPGAQIYFEPDPTIPPRAQMAVGRIARELNFHAGWSVEDGVRELARWHVSGEYGRPAEQLP